MLYSLQCHILQKTKSRVAQEQYMYGTPVDDFCSLPFIELMSSGLVGSILHFDIIFSVPKEHRLCGHGALVVCGRRAWLT